MELVDPLEVLGLAEQHQIRVAAGPHERERPQQVPVGEVLAGGDELALVRGAPLVVEPAPGRIDLQEGVLDEMPYRHQSIDDTDARSRSKPEPPPVMRRLWELDRAGSAIAEPLG